LIADSVKQVEIAHSLPQIGKIPDADPSMYVVMPTMLDPSMAPKGCHTLWIEFFAPYQVENAEGTGLNGTGWTSDLKYQVADRVIDKLAQYAPNLKNAIIARQVESPAELANYSTPVEGLFLTGAGTHPGGSISGMPGRNCARAFLHHEHPIAQTLKDAKDSLQSTVESVFGIS
jgi:beta-carotene ketolase (CrtO type)